MPTLGDGYRCGMCGNWVLPGMGHSCSGQTWPHPNYIPNYQPPPAPPPDRIADALERIAVALERLVEKA